MRTRRSYFPPTFTIPRRSRKQTTNVVEPEIRTIVEMADNHTMAQMLQALIEGYEDVIVVPQINENKIELKQTLINLVQSNQFPGRQDPHNHLRFFNKVTSTFRHFEVPNTTIKLLLFPFSLEGEARIWLDKEPSRLILTNDQDALDSAAGGNFLDKIPREYLSIIESKSKVRYSRSRITDVRANTNAPLSSSSPSNTFDLKQIAASLKDKLDIRINRFEKSLNDMKKSFVTPTAPLKAVEEWEVPSGSRNFLTSSGNALESSISTFIQWWILLQHLLLDAGTHILATVDGIQRTVSEASLRRNLKLRDKDGIVSIPDTELFENLTLMGERIAQSSTLPTVADEPASPVRDDSQREACPTDSGFIADQDRATIAKSSTLPHDLASRVTFPAANEGNAPIKGRSTNEGEAAAERIRNDSEEIAKVLTSMDAATVLAGETDVPTGSGFIPTAGPPATVISTGSEVGATASPIVTRRKGKEVMVESDTRTGKRGFFLVFWVYRNLKLRFVRNKMHKAFPLPGESSHWQYKFPLPVEGVPTARRMEIPLPGVCTAMMKKLPVKDRWQLH
nr:reverse transcriptase domain-containing protein [Tanacetum cinerariifolium]